MNIVNVLGAVGAFVVSWSNIPQIWMFIKNKHAEGISVSSTWIGFVGVALRTIYLAKVTHGDVIALGPYVFALICLVITLYYIHFPTVDRSHSERVYEAKADIIQDEEVINWDEYFYSVLDE